MYPIPLNVRVLQLDAPLPAPGLVAVGVVGAGLTGPVPGLVPGLGPETKNDAKIMYLNVLFNYFRFLYFTRASWLQNMC